MFEVIVQERFSSAHRLHHYHGSTEPMHGHNFRVEVVVRGKKLQNKVEYLVDFVGLRGALRQILGPLDHADLNTVPPFDRDNPSAENLAAYIGKQLAGLWHAPGVRIVSVTVWETADAAARYLP